MTYIYLFFYFLYLSLLHLNHVFQLPYSLQRKQHRTESSGGQRHTYDRQHTIVHMGNVWPLRSVIIFTVEVENEMVMVAKQSLFPHIPRNLCSYHVTMAAVAES